MKQVLAILFVSLLLIGCDGTHDITPTVLDIAKGHSYCNVTYQSSKIDINIIKVVEDDVVSQTYKLFCENGATIAFTATEWEEYNHPTVESFFVYAKCQWDLRTYDEQWCEAYKPK